MANSPSAPADDLVPVTPSNTVDLTVPGRGIVVEVAGTLSVITASGNTRIIPAAFVTAGVVFPLSVKRVTVANTTATGIWVLT